MRISWLPALLFAAVLGSCLARPATAATLFINLNDSPTELEAARRLAQDFGEELFVFPPAELRPKERARILALERQLEATRARSQRAQRRGNDPGAIDREADGIDDAISALIPENARFRFETLKSFLSSPSHPPINRLVLSGHSSGVRFSGRLGSLSLTELKESGLGADLRSSFLLGCYTGTPAAAQWWKTEFPEIQFVGGYPTKGYLSQAVQNGKAVSAWILTEMRKKEGAAVAAGGRQALRLLADIENGLKDPAKGLAFIVGCDYILPKAGKVIRLGDLGPRLCENAEEFMASLREANFMPYLEGTHEIPPDSDQSPIRGFYNRLQGLQHCSSGFKHPKLLPTAEEVLALIKFRHVAENFERFYRDDVRRMKQLLGAQTNQPECQNARLLPDPQRMKTLAALDSFRSCLQGPTSPLSAEERLFLEKMQLRMAKVLRELSCVPSLTGNWIESPRHALPLGRPDEMAGCADLR